MTSISSAVAAPAAAYLPEELPREDVRGATGECSSATGLNAATATMDYEEDGEPSAVSVRLDVEVRAKQDCSVPLSMIGSAVTSYLGVSKRDLHPGSMLRGWQKDRGSGPLLEVENIRLGESSESDAGHRDCSCAYHSSKLAPRRRRISNGEKVEFVDDEHDRVGGETLVSSSNLSGVGQ